MSANLTAVLQQLLQNTSKGAPATHDTGRYLRFIEFRQPRTQENRAVGRHSQRPQALSDVFAAIQRFWKTLDFKVTDTIEQGIRVAMFAFFTYRSNATGKEITSPFGLLARFEGGQGCLSPVSRGQLRHRGVVQNGRCYTVPQRSFGQRV